MSLPASLADCLRDADGQLQAALRKLENGEQLNEPIEPDTTSSAEPVDPDDLAAAFFAQQAKKKQAESALPIDAWARTIHATRQPQNREEMQGTSTSILTSTEEPLQPDANPSKVSLDQKVEDLWCLFQKAYQEA